MNILLGILPIVIGLVGLFRPSFYYKAELLNPEQIRKNERIWKYGGILLIVLGAVDLAISILHP